MQGMLGDNEALRSLMGGPLTDFLVKYNSDPKKWKPAFNKFLREENPWSGRLEIRIPALTKMAARGICLKYGVSSVERDNSPTTEVVMVLETVLRDGENSISGKEYETRLRTVPGQLGLSQALWLMEHQDEFPSEFMALLGKIYIDFPATIAVNSRGHRDVPYLGQDGSRWDLSWGWLVDGFHSSRRVARSRPPAERAGK